MARDPAPSWIPPKILDRLEIHERTPSGRARSYVDPVTGETFTQYAIQKATAFGLAPAEAAQLRARGEFAAMQRAHKRHEHVGQLLDRAARHTGKTKRELIRSGEFAARVRDLSRKARTARSKKAAALEYFGYRPAGAPFDIGESDDVLLADVEPDPE